MKLKDIVKDNNLATINYYCGGNLYYTLEVEGIRYQFPVNVEPKEVGTSVFEKTMKAITLMRYIRKAIENDELIKIR